MLEDLQVYAIAVLLYESVIYIWFIDQFLTRRFPRWITILLTLALQLLSYEATSDHLKFGLQLFSDLITLLISYKGKPLHNGIYTILFYAIMFLCDTVLAALLYLVSGTGLNAINSVTRLHILLSVISRAILPLFLYLLAKFWPKTQFKWTVLYPIPVMIITVQFFFSPFGDQTLFYEKPKWLYILIVVFMYACMLYAILVQRARHRQSEYMHKLQIMDIHNNEQLRYIKEIQYAYKSLSKHIHDARHHLDLLNTYIMANKWVKAQDYLGSLYCELDNVVINYTGNPDIDSIIFSKQLAFPKVKISVNGLLPDTINWLETVDICALLANALTNAAHACDGIMDASIDVEFLYREWLIITVKNPYVVPPIINNGQYISQKGSGHGLGINNMRAITEKYNGYLLIESTDGEFRLNIMLQRKEGSHGIHTE